MAVPTHREDCQTQLFPWRCPDCGDRVYFFGCTCGSRVFFDTPGPPWDLHSDHCIHFLIRELREIRGLNDNEIVRMVREHARETNVTPSKDIHDYIDNQHGPKKLSVLEVLPGEDDQMTLGVVREVNKVNFEKRFGIEGTPLGRQFLGAFKHGVWKEIIIREPDKGKGKEPRYQFTFYVKDNVFDSSILRRGNIVIVHLKIIRVMGNKRFWVSEDFREA